MHTRQDLIAAVTLIQATYTSDEVVRLAKRGSSQCKTFDELAMRYAALSYYLGNPTTNDPSGYICHALASSSKKNLARINAAQTNFSGTVPSPD